ncbi:unnamed protein product, partial [Meganyctiphanes norvegica]
EMQAVICKYEEETKKKNKIRKLEARNNVLSQYITSMNDVMKDESQQALGYLPIVILKAGHEKSKRESLKHYQDAIKSDCRLSLEANMKELEKVLDKKLEVYLNVNKKKEESALFDAKLRCISEYLDRLNNLINANEQEHLLVSNLRSHHKTIKNYILDQFKKLTLFNDQASAKIKEMKNEVEK